MAPKCYNPETPGCSELVKAFGNKLPAMAVATLWGMYDTRNEKTPLDVSNPIEAAKTLSEFNKQLIKERASQIKTKTVELAEEYRKLKAVMSADVRIRRINMISDLFSTMIDKYQKAYEGRSRKEICRGFRTSEKWVAGETEIFERIYDGLFKKMLTYKGNGFTEQARELEKVLDNWSSLVSLARIKIRNTEDIKLGHKSKIAVEALAYDFGENDMDDIFNEEESKKEGWQEVKEAISAFGSLSSRIRSLLSSIPIVDEDGKEVKDDLGFRMKMDPIQAHQILQNELRGMTSSEDMMEILKSHKSYPWVKSLVKILQEDNRLRTQFYVGFKKDWQPYSILKEVYSDGVRTFKTIFANRKGNSGTKELLSNMFSGNRATDKTIYDKEGNVNWKNLQSLRTLISEYFGTPEGKNDNVFTTRKFFEKKDNVRVISREEQIKIVGDILSHLGITLTNEQLSSLIAKRAYKLADELEALVTYGINASLSGEIKTLNEGGIPKQKKIKAVIQDKVARDSDKKESSIEEHIRKISELVYDFTKGISLESSARYIKNGKGITMYSDVAPSYLGTFIGAIRRFVDAEDIKGLQKLLDSKFLDSPMFKDEDGNILNYWMRDLYNSKLNDSSSFANVIEYKRFLGENDHPFEDFTPKQHMIDLWSEFWGPKQQSNGKSEEAYYPTFILGDSGVAKFIKAKIYSMEELKKGFYSVYKQEIIRMGIANKIDSKGPKEFSNNKNVFTNLVFLNKDFKSSDGKIGKYAAIMGENPTEEKVIEALDSYMQDCIQVFKKEMENQGLLSTVTRSVYNKNTKTYETIETYEYLSQSAKNEEELNKAIETYYWNSKFAMIQQLQLMTIDPAFYKGTKDMQKRYKEIHAPGTALDIFAKDDNDNYYAGFDVWSGNINPETALYIEDEELDARETDPGFMNAVVSNFGEEGKAAYEKYYKNNLTDGQGWRTLEGYKKVMGMLGEWDEDMENAYQRIKELRTLPKDSSGRLPIEALEEISKLAVVFQPVKPFMFTIENYDLGEGKFLKIPVQHKYAEAVIIPELLPDGNKLKDLAEYMDNYVDELGEARPIDLVCATSCVKVGAYGSANVSNLEKYDSEITKEDGTEITNKDRLYHALGKAVVHKLSYSDYRKQTNVPNHVDSSQLFGTQIRKLIMSGLELNNDYNYLGEGVTVNLGGNVGNVKLNGRNLVSFYNSLISANILDSLEEFEQLVSSPEKVSELLMQAVIDNERESEDNMFSFSLEDDGLFAIPLCEGGLEHDSAALLLSIFKKRVNKQKIKGGSFVQVSAFGIDGYEEDGGLKYKTSEDGKNLLWAECEIPFDFSYTDASGNKVELDFYDYCDRDGYPLMGSNGKTLLEEKFPGILDFIAYRIPTERHYSMLNLRVKKFSHKQNGGTIKVPSVGTTIAGFDFDIDKLYFMRREYKMESKELTEEQIEAVWKRIYTLYPSVKTALEEARMKDPNAHDRLYKYWSETDIPGVPSEVFAKMSEAIYGVAKFEEYDTSLTPLENSRVARNNMLIDLMQKRLMDPETFKSRYTPGGFSNCSDSARIMRELEFGDLSDIVNSDGSINWTELQKRTKDKDSDPEPNYDPSDPLTLIQYNQQNQVASKLIGVFANQNTNHAFASLMSEFSLNTPIEFAGHTKEEGYGYNLLKGPRGVDTSLAIAELLAASVDAVKDPVLNFLNLNTLTANAGALLARLGYSSTEIGLLLNQPIIKDICDYAFNSGIKDQDIAIKHIVQKYEDACNQSVYRDSKSLTSDRLAHNMLMARKNKDSKEKLMSNNAFVVSQLQVAMLFTDILSSAKEVTSFIQATKFTAANAVGSTFGDMYNQQLRVQDYLDNLGSSSNNLKVVVSEMHNQPVANVYMEDASKDGHFDKTAYINSILGNPFAYEQTMYDANRRAIQALNKYFPYDTNLYSGMRNYLGSLTKTGVLDAETINYAHSEMMVFLLTTLPNSTFNGSSMVDSDTNRRDYYINKYPGELRSYINTHIADLKNNPLIERLMIVDLKNEGSEIQLDGAINSNPRTKDSIREGWAALKDQHPFIAEGLFFYNFFNSGFTFGPSSFMHLVPTEIKEDIAVYEKDGKIYTYRDVLNEIVEGNLIKTDNSIVNREFSKQFILNHLDNYRLAFTPGDGSDIAKLLREESMQQRGTIKVYRDSFTINLTDDKWEKNGFYVLNRSDDVNKEYSFKPCLVINGIPYICDNNAQDGSPFNTVKGSPVITYHKYSPLGKKNVSVSYNFTTSFYDENISYLEGPNSPVGSTGEGEFSGTNTTINRLAAELEIIDLAVKTLLKTGNIMNEEIDGVKSDLSSKMSTMKDNDIMELVESVRSDARKVGVEVLDENGNVNKSC